MNRNLNNIEFRRIGDEITEEVKEFIAKFYSPLAELPRAANVPLEEAVAVHMQRATNLLLQNVSIGAFENESGKLVAICLSSIRVRSQIEYKVDTTTFESKFKWRAQIKKMVKHLEGNIFEELGAEKICSMHMLIVHTSYARKGIGTSIAKRMMILAADLGCDFAIAHVTSLHAMEIVNKLDWCLLRSIDLLHYTDEDQNETNLFVHAKPPNNLFSLVYRQLAKL